MRKDGIFGLATEGLKGGSRTVALDVVDLVGRRIVSGDIPEGVILPNENAISREFDIGRGAVREAMKMLSAKGLVEARPRRGTQVKEARSWNILDRDVLRWLRESAPERQIMLELLELRRGVEPEAAALAAERASRVQVERIAQGLERMRQAGEGRGDAIEADIAFHEAIIAATGNRFFVPMAAVVRTALFVTVPASNARSNARVGDIPDHAAVLEAIRRRDAPAARAAMNVLLERTMALISSPGARRLSRR